MKRVIWGAREGPNGALAVPCEKWIAIHTPYHDLEWVEAEKSLWKRLTLYVL